jgi:anti-sigma regulatory factor (Ser/Thr protein kinase)
MLLCFSTTFIFNTVFTLWIRLLQIENHMKIVNTMNFMEQMFIAAAAIIGMRLTGVTAVWLSQPVAEILCLATVGIWIRSRLGRRPETPEEWMKLPEDFGAKDEDVLEYMVRSVEEVTTISMTIMAFLEEKGIGKRTRSVVGLSVEEMAGNVIRYGTREGGTHTVEIRVVAEDPLVVRVRDDCRAFDPKQWLNQFEPQDPVKNVGIRMITRLTKEMDYRNDAGINTLLMKV